MGQYDFAGAVTTFSALAAAHPADAGVDAEPGARPHQSPGRLRSRRGRASADHAGQPIPPSARAPSTSLGLLRLHAGRDGRGRRGAERGGGQRSRATPTPPISPAQALLASAPERGADVVRQGPGHSIRGCAAPPTAPSRRLQRLGRADEAAPMLAQFQALERDPRAELAEFEYTRMGPLAMALHARCAAGTGPSPTVPLRSGRPLPPHRGTHRPPAAGRAGSGGRAWRHHRRRPRWRRRGRPLPAPTPSRALAPTPC